MGQGWQTAWNVEPKVAGIVLIPVKWKQKRVALLRLFILRSLFASVSIGGGSQGWLFSVDDGFVNSIPTGCGDTPVVGGVLVDIDSDLASFYFFVGIDTHDSVIFYCLTS